jgi:hypothetical protein
MLYKVPGAPVETTDTTKPITVSMEQGSIRRIHLTCQDSSVTPSTASITSFANGNGTLYQAPVASGADTTLGTELTTFPTTLSSSTADVMYKAPSYAVHDRFNFSMTCGGVTESGYVYVMVMSAPVAATDISLTVVANTPARVSLYGTNEINGLLQAEITSLPKRGTIYQMSVSNPREIAAITSVPTTVTHPFHLILYEPANGQVGSDSIGFKMYHGGLSSNQASVKISIQSWNYPPSIPALTNLSIVDRNYTTIDLKVDDLNNKQFVGVYITSLPKKAKLYQVKEDGSRGIRAVDVDDLRDLL